jgi:hypothetical protein
MSIRHEIPGYVLTIALLLCQQVTCGETIVLKSGKTIEGKIVEKTDTYMKVDIGGATLTYYRDEIKEDAPAQGTSTPQGTASDWHSWYVSIADYLKKMNELSRKVEDLQKQAEVLILKARQSGDKAMLTQGLSEIDTSLDLALNELNTMSPPEELSGFHSGIKKSIVSEKALVRAAFEDRKNDIRTHLKESVSAVRDAYIMLVNVCRKHGVPEEEIASVENLIRILDSFIGYDDIKIK